MTRGNLAVAADDEEQSVRLAVAANHKEACFIVATFGKRSSESCSRDLFALHTKTVACGCWMLQGAVHAALRQ